MHKSSTAIARRKRNTFSIMGHNPASVAISLAVQLAGPFAKTKPSFLGITRVGDRRHPQPSWAPCPPATNGTETSRLSWERRPVKLTLWEGPLSAAQFIILSARGRSRRGRADPPPRLRPSRPGFYPHFFPRTSLRHILLRRNPPTP